MNPQDKMHPEELESFLDKYDIDDKRFAELLGVTEQAVKSWLHGKRKVPPTTAKLVRFFDNQPQRLKEF